MSFLSDNALYQEFPYRFIRYIQTNIKHTYIYIIYIYIYIYIYIHFITFYNANHYISVNFSFQQRDLNLLDVHFILQ